MRNEEDELQDESTTRRFTMITCLLSASAPPNPPRALLVSTMVIGKLNYPVKTGALSKTLVRDISKLKVDSKRDSE